MPPKRTRKDPQAAAEPAVTPVKEKEKKKKEETVRQQHILTLQDIEARKNAKIEELKAKTNQRLRYADTREQQRQVGIIEKARLNRLNPTAFASQNAPVFDMTGQTAQQTPEELDEKQRKETIKALGKQSQASQPQNFVVEKPLKPNALDIYQAQKIQQRDTVRNQKAFVPVQKM